jgi:hypothetical protein
LPVPFERRDKRYCETGCESELEGGQISISDSVPLRWKEEVRLTPESVPMNSFLGIRGAGSSLLDWMEVDGWLMMAIPIVVQNDQVQSCGVDQEKYRRKGMSRLEHFKTWDSKPDVNFYHFDLLFDMICIRPVLPCLIGCCFGHTK